MTDGLGSVSYVYNTLSRLESETRTFTGVAGTFKLDYAYNLAGELTSLTAPTQFGSVNVGYSYDTIGRPTGVTGANYAGVSNYVTGLTYRAFGMKQMSYSNGKTLSLLYDNRMRVTSWNVPGALGWSYAYNYFGENTGRATFASNLTSGSSGRDASLDRSYDYDQVGRLLAAYTGTSSLAHTGQGSTWGSEGPYAQDYGYDVWGNITHRGGWGGVGRNENLSYTNNRQVGVQYDAAGNLVDGTWYTFSYDATGQQTRAACPGYVLDQWYDGDRLRGKKVDNGSTTYYLRSSVLGGQVVAELNGSGAWSRGFVYLGGQMVALQGGTGGAVSWVHQDPVTKSQRITDSNGTVVSKVDLDPFGGDTSASSNAAFQPHRYTSYERDVNGADDAMMRRYNRYWGRFDQPDPSDGSYDATDPQSFNRYAYVNNDPVNFVDPSGLNLESLDYRWSATDGVNPMGIGGPGIHVGSGWGSTGVNDLSGPGVIDPFGRTSVPFTFVFIGGGVFGSGGGWTGTGGTTPQNTEPQPNNPCPPVPEAPTNANLNQNIRDMATLRDGTGANAGYLWGSTALSLAAQRYGIFYALVRTGGSWDYKQQDAAGAAQGRSRYEAFGNFNYGATGAAAGFSEGQLLRLAGRAHVQARSPGGAGTSVGLTKGLLGIGGKAPFGDQQSDQDVIRQGSQYYRSNCF